MKILIGLLAALLVGGGLWYFMKKPPTTTNQPTAPTLPDKANPYNNYNPNAPLAIDLPAPTTAAVNADLEPYNTAINNAAFAFAQRPADLATARAAANSPAAAFNSVVDANDRQKILAAFSGLGNPLSREFPLPSKFNEVLSPKIDSLITAINTAQSVHSGPAFSSWLLSNRPTFTISYWNLDISPLVNTFKLNGRLNVLKSFFQNLKGDIERLNTTLRNMAINSLKQQGYNFITPFA